MKYCVVRLHKKNDGGMVNFNNICSILSRYNYEYSSVLESYSGLLSYFRVCIAAHKNKGSVYILNQSFLCLVLYFVLYYTGSRFIYIIDSLDNNYPANGFIESFKSKVILFINSFIIRRRGVFVISETCYLACKIKDIAPDVDVNILHTPYPFYPKLRTSYVPAKNLLYIGRLSQEKGVDNLVDFISRSDSDVNFTIVGDGEDREKFLRLVGERVQYLGWLDGDELYAQYERNDVFIHFPVKDAFPTVLREALCYSMPVVSLSVQGIPEIVESGIQGIILSKYDFIECSKAVDDVLNNYKQYCENAYNKALSNGMPAYEAKFNQILSKESGA